MFREMRSSSLGLPEKLSVPSEKADFGCQQKQEQLLCSASPLPLAWRATRGQNPPAAASAGARGGQQPPETTLRAQEPPTAPAVATKCHTRAKLGVKHSLCVQSGREEEQGMSQGVVITQRAPSSPKHPSGTRF